MAEKVKKSISLTLLTAHFSVYICNTFFQYFDPIE